MTDSQKDYIKNWLLKANEDVAVMERLASENPEYYTSAISFHSQQAVEKFLKAFLVFSEIEFPKTHDIDFLLNECIKIEKKGFDELNFKNLADFAVKVRYPDDILVPTLLEALEFREIANCTKKTVEEKILLNLI